MRKRNKQKRRFSREKGEPSYPKQNSPDLYNSYKIQNILFIKKMWKSGNPPKSERCSCLINAYLNFALWNICLIFQLWAELAICIKWRHLEPAGLLIKTWNDTNKTVAVTHGSGLLSLIYKFSFAEIKA